MTGEPSFSSHCLFAQLIAPRHLAVPWWSPGMQGWERASVGTAFVGSPFACLGWLLNKEEFRDGLACLVPP